MLHLAQAGIEIVTGAQKVNDEMRHPQGLILSNIGGEIVGSAYKRWLFAARALSAQLYSMAAVDNIEVCWITAFGLAKRAQAFETRFELLRGAHGEARIGADGVPAIAQLC